jgi:hypothetical protein
MTIPGILSIVLLLFTSISLLILREWRISLLLLAILYIPVFLLVNQLWPVQMALVKIIAGWISCLLLGIGAANFPGNQISINIPFLNRNKKEKKTQAQRTPTGLSQTRAPLGDLFTLFAAGTIFLASVALAFRISGTTGNEYIYPVLGGITLIGMGLLQIGFTNEALFISIGLLTITAGFEIIYAMIDSSILVAGLLAAANLGIAMIGAYLLTAPQMEDQI